LIIFVRHCEAERQCLSNEAIQNIEYFLLNRPGLISRLLRQEGFAFLPRNDGKKTILFDKSISTMSNTPSESYALCHPFMNKGVAGVFVFAYQFFHAFVVSLPCAQQQGAE
jgi:hypothetical protein